MGREYGTRVNAYTEWGNLREVVVGNADGACFIPEQPAMVPEINHEGGSCALDDAGEVEETTGTGGIVERELGGFPRGPKSPDVIAAANAQLDNLVDVLRDRGIKVRRPDANHGIDWSASTKTPLFDVESQYCATCPRDVVATVGNIVLEASMSRRDRFFEVYAFRKTIEEIWKNDRDAQWKSAPKPSMSDEMYDEKWWDLDREDRYRQMHAFSYCLRNNEPIFDAADMMRFGKDVFVQVSMTANECGIEWLRRELAPHGFRVHVVRFPYDLAPSHLDCTFVPLRPGLILTNPERPLFEEDAPIFEKNGWRFIDAPQPNNPIRPWASQSSKWLSMNVLSLSPTCVVAEEQETDLHELLESEGFEVVKVPFRAVYEFGGGLHCATWDITRDDHAVDLFPNQP